MARARRQLSPVVAVQPGGLARWREIAAAWEAAVSKESGSAAAIKTFKNTELGETWVEEGEAPDWQRLVERREDYRVGSVPQGGLLLVGAADVQKDRIEASVWAFGRGKESWLVEHRVLMGDTARDTVWKRLAEMLAENWTHASGAAMPLARFAWTPALPRRRPTPSCGPAAIRV
jgi:phage terminase large subunit GpA-like protein